MVKHFEGNLVSCSELIYVPFWGEENNNLVVYCAVQRGSLSTLQYRGGCLSRKWAFFFFLVNHSEGGTRIATYSPVLVSLLETAKNSVSLTKFSDVCCP